MIVGIVGLGLMGGSLGLALRSVPQVNRVVGYDRNPHHSAEALERRLVDAIVSWEELKRCDVIFLAIPVEGIIKALHDLTDIPPRTTIIDLGSTKAKIVDNIPPKIRKNVVPAHPMTGTEKFGPSAALANLYRDKIVVLCDLEKSGELQRETAKALFKAIGMKIVTMDAHEHDRHAAYISHLPHAISYALANAVMAQEDAENILILAAGGFRDMSRLAKSSPIMWEEIFKQNRGHLLEAMDHFEEELRVCRALIMGEKWEDLRNWMEEAQKLHDIL
ncbi:prephenate dehydrogenase [Hydrogenimonas sp.]|jgi:prephenate dehydrogenase|uniref:prephenate dehydrogenase n=1 Tax=Hydrogenimonas sp. TaxID=2231112 RepID=UPI00261DAD9F|nr:prephenate dehydrogenase [Hydrogenimonas sp.]